MDKFFSADVLAICISGCYQDLLLGFYEFVILTDQCMLSFLLV